MDRAADDHGSLTLAIGRSARLRREKTTKARKVRHVPVHPVLARLLAEWKLHGWAKWYGRQPGPDDLIVPSRASTSDEPRFRNVMRATRRWNEDLERLKLRVRRQHDARRTFRSLCLSDGARRDILHWVTHGRPGDVEGLYDQPTWDAVCAEVAKLKITLERASSSRYHVPRRPGPTPKAWYTAWYSPRGLPKIRCHSAPLGWLEVERATGIECAREGAAACCLAPPRDEDPREGEARVARGRTASPPDALFRGSSEANVAATIAWAIAAIEHGQLDRALMALHAVFQS